MKSGESHCNHELASDVTADELGESHCNHELASDVRRGGRRRRKEKEDVMTSKNLTTLTWQVGKKACGWPP